MRKDRKASSELRSRFRLPWRQLNVFTGACIVTILLMVAAVVNVAWGTHEDLKAGPDPVCEFYAKINKRLTLLRNLGITKDEARDEMTKRAIDEGWPKHVWMAVQTIHIPDVYNGKFSHIKGIEQAYALTMKACEAAFGHTEVET